VVKVAIGFKNSELVVAPNPVKGKVINLQLSNYERGVYAVSVYNGSGTKVYSSSFNHTGGSASQSLQLPAGTKPGVYTLQLLNGGKVVSKSIVVE
jgi:hypothetical protein